MDVKKILLKLTAVTTVVTLVAVGLFPTVVM